MIEEGAFHSLISIYHIAYTEKEHMFRAAIPTGRNGEARGKSSTCVPHTHRTRYQSMRLVIMTHMEL